MRRLGNIARRNSDTLTAFLMDAQLLDSERCRRWSTAFVKFMKQESSNERHLLQWVNKWSHLTNGAIDAFCKGLGEDADAAATEAIAATKEFRRELGVEP
jgi:toluene monooxygenase system protein E